MANLLSIAQSGLNASKKALETTGHNLANATTEGYSRQRVSQQTATPVIKNGLIQGTGTRTTSINRIHDKFIQSRLNNSNSAKTFFNTRSDQLSQVENVFNEIDNEGLNQILNNFFNAFRDLANAPENDTIRSIVRDISQLATKDFRRIRMTLDGMSKNIDSKIESSIVDINQTSKQIAKLNYKITILEATGSETGDLRDERDLAIKTLSEYFKVNTYLDEKDQYVVNAVGVGTIVSGVNTQEFLAASSSKENSSNNMADSKDVYFKNRPGASISGKITGGKLASLLRIKNKDITSLQKNIDIVAFEFANSINRTHAKGYVGREIPLDEDGNPIAKDKIGKTSGINFFKQLKEVDGAALKITLSDDILSDLSNISTALNANSPGDNRISLAISKIQHEKLLSGGTSTLEEHFLKTIGKVGLDSGKAQIDADQAEGLFVLANNLREKNSGVSIDEEAANLVKFQHAFEASAKVMQTATEMFNTVLSIKR